MSRRFARLAFALAVTVASCSVLVGSCRRAPGPAADAGTPLAEARAGAANGGAADEEDGSPPSNRKPYAAPEGIPGECMNLPPGLDAVPPACRGLFGQ
ncbi:MAG: hypothetical protein HY907_16435 [Deltaproteobacteria bacterium]|nr:hypothetical protein [Deltaproteobacteria bacterium]